MNDQLQQLTSTNHEISKITPVPLNCSEKNVAIVVHVFYIDLWQDISNYLKNLEIEYDLFVTLPPHLNDNDILTIFDTQPDARVYMTENKGRDVLPFLHIMSIIPENSYSYICKLHTKKTGDSPLGHVWRKLLYFDLLGSSSTVNNIVGLFENNANVGIVTGKNTILDSQRYAYGNNEKIELLTKKANIIFNEHYLFPAGTMFWIRSELLKPIVDLFKDGQLVFEEEEGQKDDTLAHAVERFFGIICQENHQTIIASPSDYTLLDSKALDELVGLVLGQQYAGLDMFITQKHAIEEKDQYIQYLEALAESLRIKNRLKSILTNKVIPLGKIILKIPKKIIDILKVIKNNPSLLKKVLYYAKRGELKYMLTKIKEKTRNNLTESVKLVNISPSEYFTTFDKKEYSLDDITIDIIIPVYNGYEFLEKLFDSVEKNTTSDYRLIVINDCSPDERVKPYLLERLEKHPDAIFIEHEENQGFLKSVNEAYTYVSDHFLLLNTDTEVPAFWMERLMYPIIHMNKVASTTPFTNSGEIASFPNFVADNEIFDGMAIDTLDEVFRDVNPQDFYAEVPTGVGFCMGVNYTLTKEIGMFVEDTFGKGYGEENDWCQRAIQKGYRNFIVPNLFVYHKHGGSFSAEEKQALLKVNAIKLLDRHPNYGKDVNTYIQKDPHNTLRQLLVLFASNKSTPMHLIFDHDLGGGANIYADELVETYMQEQKNILCVKYDYYTNCFKLFHYYKDYTFAFKISSFEELQTLLSKLNIEELFLNSLVSFKNAHEILSYIHTFIEEKETKLILPIHDFYALCPSYTLLNEEGKYCNVPSLETCKSCMQNNTQEWRNFYDGEVDMPKWREVWGTLLSQSNDILCFSHSSKEILRKAYPDLLAEKIKVIPHQVKALEPIFLEDNVTDTITIGILGAINYAKGSQIIKHLVQTIDRDKLNIKVVVIGEITEHIKSEQFTSTGRYERDALPSIIQSHNIDIFLIPSVWPETFSYTTQEIMMMEMPLMVFDLGAPAERVTKYDKGYIINDISAEGVLSTVKIFNTKH